ncbi:hypothetical protein [Paenibacillus sp. E194]|uniref:hypothetical protein n=1 Tax=Paenibacillus sp. E194 TaxID=1458845 RepID=UPI000A76F4AE|nr:hypothetical protein [Paenibacillus sp. E194]
MLFSIGDANFIVITGQATASDVLALIACIQQMIQEKQSCSVGAENRVVGER